MAATTGTSGGEGQRILVVDDEPPNVELLERLLSSEGYGSVLCTSDPAEAVRLFGRIEPDLVLLDLNMPEIDGFEVMRRIGAQIDGDTYLPILVLTGDMSPTSKRRALTAGAKDFLTKPFDPSEVLARVANLLETRAMHLALRSQKESLEAAVRDRTQHLSRVNARLEETEQDLRLSRAETVHRLSLAAEFRDRETASHIQRMGRYCALLAARTGEPDDRRELIRLASEMHDVGKIAIPDRILRKAGPLTDSEVAVMRTHAEIGYRILAGSTSELLTLAATIALTHHERFDGNGYPRGLGGEEIPVVGRIAAIADVFDALTTDRVYRPAYPIADAIGFMLHERGAHFDPDLLTMFVDSMDVVLDVYLSYGGPEMGRVGGSPEIRLTTSPVAE